jgi:uncharacterized protein YqhQ
MSDNTNSETAATPKQFSYGGQAVIEGIMMRGAHIAAIAVRDPNGQIVVHEQELNKALYRGRISKTPFLRGLVLLWDALGLGTRALMWSADVALGEEEDISFDGPVGWATVAFSLLLGIGLFFLLPAAASSGLENLLGLDDSSFLVNLLEGVVRLLLVVAYIWAIGFIPDVKRLFGYHGAEHKTINAYEAGAELTPSVTGEYPIEHPRCGTAFLLNVVVVSVLVFAVLGRPPFLLLLLSRILLVPVIAGIAYEIIRFTAKHMDNPIIRAIIIPNLALQHLTTNEPDESMLEVGIVAFKRVLLSENIISEEEAAIPEPDPSARPQAVPAGD